MAAIVAFVFASSASADTSFDAHGSVEQVYATGLPAGASTSLLDSSDTVVATRNANDLGGILFRNVTLRGEPCRDYQPLVNRTASLGTGTDTSTPPDSGSNSGSLRGNPGQVREEEARRQEAQARRGKKKRRQQEVAPPGPGRARSDRRAA